ncbi:MAG: hypothetical protein JXA18_08180 [Chitinispirillaceae bacterium]|nr:hypothetical protein [Chitinispirillaceae bacterium]
MSCTRRVPIAAACFSLIIAASLAEQGRSASIPGNAPVRWVRVDQADWAVYMAAPAYHFSLAKEYLRKGDAAKAAAELSRGKRFLTFQKKRLSASLQEIDELSKK